MQVGDELAGYRVEEVLCAGKSYRARDAAGREVFLKMLEEDCLLEGKLHPSIARRLERVRELPQRHVANLHGIEREGDAVFMVCDFVRGKKLSDALLEGQTLERLAREIVLAVKALHARGLVHGVIHEGNVIVDEREDVWLIDVSPLLFTDEREDARGILQMLMEFAHKTSDAAMADRLAPLSHDDVTMAQLTEALLQHRKTNAQEEDEPLDSPRWRSLLWAAVVIAAGIAVAWSVQHYFAGAGSSTVKTER